MEDLLHTVGKTESDSSKDGKNMAQTQLRLQLAVHQKSVTE